MAHELVGQRTTDSFHQQRVVRVLENRPVSLLLDVLEILAGRAVGRILLTHVAQASGELCESLTVGALAKPTNLEMLRLQKNRTRQQRYDWLCVQHGSLSKKKRSQCLVSVIGSRKTKKIRRSEKAEKGHIVASVPHHQVRPALWAEGVAVKDRT